MTEDRPDTRSMDRMILERQIPGRDGIFWQGASDPYRTFRVLHVRATSIRVDEQEVHFAFEVLASPGFRDTGTLYDFSVPWRELSVWSHAIGIRRAGAPLQTKVILERRVVDSWVDVAARMEVDGLPDEERRLVFDRGIEDFERAHAVFGWLEDPSSVPADLEARPKSSSPRRSGSWIARILRRFVG